MQQDVSAIESLSVGTLLAFVFIPALLILAFFVAFAPLCTAHGIPSLLTLLAAILVVLLPVELGTLLFLGRKRNGRLSLEGIVLNREKMPGWLYPVAALVLFAWAALFFVVVFAKTDTYIEHRLFGWLPPWFFIDGFAKDPTAYSPAILKITALSMLALDGIAGPVVEELYFRGFLLPRMKRFGNWGPALNALLFSLYHLFSPWQNLSRIFGILPFAYFAQRKRNIYAGMIAHCALNLASSIGVVLLAFGS
jgi:membrane protease YdiL (CAAX protease family)